MPFGLWLVPALGVTWFIVERTLELESRINHGLAALTTDDRTSLLVTLLLVAFLAFTGVAAMVPGGLVQSGGALGEGNLAGPRRRRCARRRACSATGRRRSG